MFLLESIFSVSDMLSILSPSNIFFGIVLVISVSSPFVLTITSNKHQIKMKKIELLYEKKQIAYLNFAEAYYQYSRFADDAQYKKLESATNKCRLLCRNKKFSSAADDLLGFASSNVSDATRKQFYADCLDALYEDLAETEKCFK